MHDRQRPAAPKHARLQLVGLCVCVCIQRRSHQMCYCLLITDNTRSGLGPSTLTHSLARPPSLPHQPSVIHRWAELISSTVNLRRRFITTRHCGARRPSARPAAFQFHIRPITQLGLLKAVPPCKTASEV